MASSVMIDDEMVEAAEIHKPTPKLHVMVLKKHVSLVNWKSPLMHGTVQLALNLAIKILSEASTRSRDHQLSFQGIKARCRNNEGNNLWSPTIPILKLQRAGSQTITCANYDTMFGDYLLARTYLNPKYNIYDL